MNRSFIKSMGWGLCVGLVGCGSGEVQFSGFSDQAIVDHYADGVVVATYSALHQGLSDLHDAVEALSADPSETNLAAVRDAWVTARSPWELSEAYLFGPVDSYGFDPSLDDWPVNQVDLQGILNSDDVFSADYVASLDTALKGFHGAEYLIFGDQFDGTSGLKQASALTDRELEFLALMTGEMAGIAQALLESWTIGYQGEGAYAETFKTAGADDNRVYPSLESAGEEMVRGMITICDEVANGKIADPYDQQNPNLIESQFSLNSTTDFRDNIRGVQAVYLGLNPLTGIDGKGLDEFVAGQSSDLDARLKTELESAVQAVGAIPYPFKSSVVNPDDADTIEAAQEAIRTVQRTLEEEVLPLVTGQAS